MQTLEAVAQAVCASDGWSWAMACEPQKRKAAIDAKTILAAFTCGQTELDAAQRLATWDDIDAKKKRWERGWDRRSETEQAYFLKRARYGFLALQDGTPPPPEQEDDGA